MENLFDEPIECNMAKVYMVTEVIVIGDFESKGGKTLFSTNEAANKYIEFMKEEFPNSSKEYRKEKLTLHLTWDIKSKKGGLQ